MLPPKPYPSNARRTDDAGSVLRVGVALARSRWWRRLLCRLRLGHERPLLRDVDNALVCERCGHAWLDDGGIF